MIATFFLSAGRCGTQTLHAALSVLRPDAVVEHEPIGSGYRYFDRAMAHLRDVERILERCDYVETGWPCFASLPRYKALLGDRMQVVYLTRDVAEQARSLRGHGLFGSRADDFATLMTAPTAEGHIEHIAQMAPPADAQVSFEDMVSGQATETHRTLSRMLRVDMDALVRLTVQRIDNWPVRD